MNTSMSISTNMRTKAHPVSMSISIPDMKKKSINTKRRIKDYK